MPLHIYIEGGSDLLEAISPHKTVISGSDYLNSVESLETPW